MFLQCMEMQIKDLHRPLPPPLFFCRTIKQDYFRKQYTIFCYQNHILLLCPTRWWPIELHGTTLSKIMLSVSSEGGIWQELACSTVNSAVFQLNQ